MPDEATTILICDDEPSLRELMRISLSTEYSFLEASHAGEAIELVQRVEPDLVLLDVMLPGASGLTVLESVRGGTDSRDTPVLVISAFSAESDQCAALGAGASGFLRKPFDPEELKTLVEDLLAART
jgi:DNA-binding response OmpR family regulator